MTEVRLLRPGDEHVLHSCADDVFDDPIDPRSASEFLADERHDLAVAIDDGVVVGFASAVHYVHPDKPRPELWINEVAVATSHQGHGIGRRLMDELLGVARRLGCSEAWVLTDATNGRAQRLYASAGGEPSRDHVMFTFRIPTEET